MRDQTARGAHSLLPDQSFLSTLETSSSNPLAFPNPHIFCHLNFNPLEFSFQHSRMLALSLLGKTRSARAAEKPWVSLLKGRRRRRGNLLFMMSSHTSWYFCFGHADSRSCGLCFAQLQCVWKLFLPSKDAGITYFSDSRCQYPRCLYPSITKGWCYHFHFEWIVVGGHWGRRQKAFAQLCRCQDQLGYRDFPRHSLLQETSG